MGFICVGRGGFNFGGGFEVFSGGELRFGIGWV